MRPAELLALAATAARTAPSPTKTSAGDADAFAQALGAQVDSARTDPGATPKTTGEEVDTVQDTPVRPRGFLHNRPDRAGLGEGLALGRDPEVAAARSDWRDFIRSLREMGLLAGPGSTAETKPGAAETSLTGPSSTPKTTGDDAAAEPTPFSQALDALGAAIQAALADPSANAAEAGQLPPAVQTALDAAVALAPLPLQGRIAAFAERLAQRLGAAMGGEGTTAETAQAAADARPAPQISSPAAQAIVAALHGAGDGSALAILKDLKAKGDLADQLRGDRAPTARVAASDTSDDPTASTGRVARAPAADPAPAKGADAAPAVQASTTDQAAQARTGAEAQTELAAASDPVTPETPAVAPATAPAQPAEARAAAHLAAVRGAPELVAQMAAVISRKLEGRVTRFNMELNPAEMGRVDVKLSIDADGRVAAQMAFDNPAAAADMRGKADELRRQLEASGFNVASEDLTFTDRDQGGQQFAGDLRDQAKAADDNARGRAFREAERTVRLAEDAGRLSNRAVLGLDMRV